MPEQPPDSVGGGRSLNSLHYDVALYRALVESAREYAIFATDLEGRILVWNCGAERVTGYREEEILGQPISFLYTSEDRRDMVPERDMEAASSDGVIQQTRRWARKDGTRFWANGTLELLCDENGTRIGFTQILRDETDRIRAEQDRSDAIEALREVNSRLLAAGIREQEARDAADTANCAKDEFLAIVSHELRTPLNAMLGWAEVLRSKQVDQGLVAHALETIERNANLQRTVIDDLLDVSSALSGSLRVRCSSVELQLVISVAVDANLQAAEAKSIQLESVLDTSIGPVWGDAQRLHQILSNLLSNAIKFTPDGGRIDVVLDREETQACIRVRDTGSGIDPEFLPHAFDRFRQADTTSRRQHRGLGLGLAIVRHLVELQDGTVHAESAGIGRGSTLTVRLPLAVPAARATGRPRDVISGKTNVTLDNMPRLDGTTVLVVEDDPDARAVYTLILESRGASVTAVGSAHEALAEFEREPPDVLVSDIGMPDADGYDLIRLVRDRAPEHGGSVPAAALTAYASSEDRARALKAGFQTHVDKPVGAAELVAVIASLLAHHRRSVGPERRSR